MPGTQIPLWVTYSLAVIAILGPLGGALLGGIYAAKLDVKRSARELLVEDKRWHREHRREREMRIFEERKAAYAQAIVAVSGCLQQVYKMQRAFLVGGVDQVDLAPESAMFDQASIEVFNAVAVVELIGSSAVESALQRVMTVVINYSHELEAFADSGSMLSKRQIDAFEARVAQVFQELRQAARQDIEALMPVIPTRPSETIS